MLSSARVSTSSARDAWLSLTPEPERELPWAVAALRAAGEPPAGDVARERERVERLVVRGRRGAWLSYMGEVVDLVDGAVPRRDSELGRARAVAAAVVRNHHLLLLGLPGRAAEDTEPDRLRLEALSGEPRTSNGGGR